MSVHSVREQHNAALILQPVGLGGLQLRNRIAVAPMTRVSASPDGVPTARMATYYAEFGRGEFGLIISEGIFPEARFGPGYARQPGLVTRAQMEAWRRVTDAVHEASGVIFAQIMHAGALSQSLEYTLAPSAIRPRGAKMPEYGGSGGFPIPRAMDRHDIDRVVESFARAAQLALTAGFDGVEVHGANGYLIDQFLTDYTNHRDDEYGGDISARARFACDVLRAVRREVGTSAIVGIRLSQTKVNDFTHRWLGGEADAEVIFAAVRDAGASYIHIAGEGRAWRESAQLVGSERTPTQVARTIAKLPVMANGALHDPQLADSLLRAGQADLVSVGRGAIANPDWPRRLRVGQAVRAFEPDMIHPEATIEHTDRWLERPPRFIP
jgi:2,4-dienoyl-CoA reductase-like NADH-dependent reductase (Old Yellow Enzyme family)